MRQIHHLLVFWLFLASNHFHFANAQNEGYDDFGQDNLYHDYAMRQEEKEAAAAA